MVAGETAVGVSRRRSPATAVGCTYRGRRGRGQGQGRRARDEEEDGPEARRKMGGGHREGPEARRKTSHAFPKRVTRRTLSVSFSDTCSGRRIYSKLEPIYIFSSGRRIYSKLEPMYMFSRLNLRLYERTKYTRNVFG
jgi:hypothetical protein